MSEPNTVDVSVFNDSVAAETEAHKARALRDRGIGFALYVGTLMGIGWSIWAWVR